MGLPGSVYRISGKGLKCDVHEDRLATRQVQGETDSFGAEYTNMCDSCYDDYRSRARKPYVGICERCSCEAELGYCRDWEEGTSGPVYRVCARCARVLTADPDGY